MGKHNAGDGNMSTSEKNSYRRAGDPNRVDKHAAKEDPKDAPKGKGK